MFQLLDLLPKYRMIIIFALAMLSSWLVFTPILKIAKKKDIVDNPEARKLQKEPIPILGGVVVFFGIIIGITFFKTWFSYISIFPVVSAMVIMLYIGVMDDISGIKPKVRLVLELLTAILIIYSTHFYISNFQGLWGIDTVSKPVGIALSILTFVGLVNAYNMIDGIDGLSSSLGIQMSLFMFLLFFLAHDYSYAALAMVSMAAMVPFFMHNVFGWSSKMFIGDGGTMVMGTMFSAMVFKALSTNFSAILANVTERSLESIFPLANLNLIAFTLAVFSLPVADTLRVMFERIAVGKSPLEADNRHLHHLYIRNNYSHIGTTIRENILNLSCIMTSILLWICGAGMEWQLYGVIMVAFVANLTPVLFLRYVLNHPESRFGRFVGYCAEKSHVERKGAWLKIQKLIDRD